MLCTLIVIHKWVKNMVQPKDLSGSVIFPKGAKASNDFFTGSVWMETLVPADSAFNFQILNVTFEPGARSHWHRHTGGQILLVTGGTGGFQEEGKPPRFIREGEIVRIGPDVKHWHGAAPDSWFVHVVVIPNPEKEHAEWLEPVSDKEYMKLKEGKK